MIRNAVLLMLLIGLVFACLITGCGGGAGGTVESTTTTIAAAPTIPVSTTTVSVTSTATVSPTTSTAAPAVTTTTFSTSTTTTTVPLYWSRRYVAGQDNECRALATVEGGGFLLTGRLSPFDAGTAAWAARLDESGGLVWQTKYNPQVTPNALLPTPDGGFIMVGESYTGTAGGADIFAAKLDSAGAVVWAKNFGTAYDDGASALCAVAPGQYVLGGYGNFAIGQDPFAWLIALSDAGAILWQKKYDASFQQDFEGLTGTADGGLIAVGYTAAGDGGSALVAKLDQSGNIQWQKRYGGSGQDVAQAVCAASGGYVLAGRTDSFGVAEESLWVARLDATGEVIGERLVGESAYANGLRVVPAGSGFMVGGMTGPSNSSKDYLLIKLDSAGGILWQRRYNNLNGDYLSALLPLPDGYLAGGTADFWSSSTRGSNAWLVKFNAAGDDPPTGEAAALSSSLVTSAVATAELVSAESAATVSVLGLAATTLVATMEQDSP